MALKLEYFVQLELATQVCCRLVFHLLFCCFFIHHHRVRARRSRSRSRSPFILISNNSPRRFLFDFAAPCFRLFLFIVKNRVLKYKLNCWVTTQRCVHSVRAPPSHVLVSWTLVFSVFFFRLCFAVIIIIIIINQEYCIVVVSRIIILFFRVFPFLDINRNSLDIN